MDEASSTDESQHVGSTKLSPNFRDTGGSCPSQIRQVSHRRLPPFPGNSGHSSPRKASNTFMAKGNDSITCI